MTDNEHPLSQEEFSDIYSKVPRLTVEVVIRGESGIFLTKRSSGPCRDLWHIPGGTVRFGEPLTEAVRRISKRELDIDVTSTKLLGYVEYPSHYEHGLDSPVGIAFLVTSYDGEIRINDEVEDSGWFKDLPQQMHEEQVAFINQ